MTAAEQDLSGVWGHQLRTEQKLTGIWGMCRSRSAAGQACWHTKLTTSQGFCTSSNGMMSPSSGSGSDCLGPECADIAAVARSAACEQWSQPCWHDLLAVTLALLTMEAALLCPDRHSSIDLGSMQGQFSGMSADIRRYAELLSCTTATMDPAWSSDVVLRICLDAWECFSPHTNQFGPT